jgi:hypothetical protein
VDRFFVGWGLGLNPLGFSSHGYELLGIGIHPWNSCVFWSTNSTTRPSPLTGFTGWCMEALKVEVSELK